MPPLDREALNELLRLAKALAAARHAHMANPGGLEAWRVYINAKDALTQKADSLVSLIELAGEGLEAREGKAARKYCPRCGSSMDKFPSGWQCTNLSC